ncbi:DinB family protein [Sphingobacterium cellulitidis]|uniref:DinB family protein n=1 Tax=Sphingobacterium cellulitidis TaxID=1768011 RepID=UPI000B944073|nr:DinB superfamily protein [Sphingobacterium cellulitidis]
MAASVITTIKTLFERDLNKLKQEIETYRDERNIWHIEKNIANSAGNLCLHLIGNLNTYVGAQIGKTGYVRNRPEEFALKDIPRAELIKQIDGTIEVVSEALDRLTEKNLDEEYPMLVFEKKTTYAFFLVHLATHLAYHLGQINYHRRLIDRI